MITNVFRGHNAVRDFMNPDNSPPTPLVELPVTLNPFAAQGVRIFAKLMQGLPLFNIKELTALALLHDAEDRGTLEGVHTLVENSSGNTAFSLGILARLFGISNVQAIVPADIAANKLELVRLLGDAEIRYAKFGESGVELARELGVQPGFLNLGQYENEANPAAHERWTLPQIWQQTERQVSVFCAGMGTTGTVLGASRFFARENPRVAVVGVMCEQGSAVPGVRSDEKLKEISLPWRGAFETVQVGTKDSFRMSLRLCRAGIIAGPSSGFALAGLQKFLAAGHLDNLRNASDEVCAVFICADTPFPYLDKYTTHLNPEDL